MKTLSSKSSKVKVAGIFSLLFFHIIHIHILKPLCTIFQIIYIIFIVDIAPDADQTIERRGVKRTYIESGIITAGWAIMILFPIINIINKGMKIILLHESFLSKVFITIYLTIETFLNLPMTFLYSNSTYSIFLFEERGIEQLLSPTMIFFPTTYSMSNIELVRHLLEPAFFFGIGLLKNEQISENFKNGYLVILLQIMLCLCFIKFMVNFLLIIYKIWSLCVRKVNKSK
jgi:hypothetical protein